MKFSIAMKMTEKQARDHLEKLLWPDGPTCPHCQSKNVTILNNQATAGRKKREGLFKCRDCRKQFSLTVGTIFERSHIPLKTWIMAFSLFCASKKGVSALQISRMLDLSYKSAWFLCHRIRWAMTQEPLKVLLNGDVECDESVLGGSVTNKKKYIQGICEPVKTPVIACVERKGNVRVNIVPAITSKNLHDTLIDCISPKARIFTDEHRGYIRVGREFKYHGVVNHSMHEYVKGIDSTNTVESFFSLLKRGVNGAFHHVSRTHLPKYCSEFAFRWNNRKTNDGKRVNIALKTVKGKRLLYKEPIKKVA